MTPEEQQLKFWLQKKLVRGVGKIASFAKTLKSNPPPSSSCLLQTRHRHDDRQGLFLGDFQDQVA